MLLFQQLGFSFISLHQHVVGITLPLSHPLMNLFSKQLIL
jgi:hypothetical protein